MLPFSPGQFNQHFGHNFSNKSEELVSNGGTDENGDGFYFRGIDILELWSAISSIKSLAVGFDDINIKFVRLIFPIISDRLLHIFNVILTNSRFPSLWKKSIIIPVPKVKLPTNVSDFRPISILSSLSKAFERIMCWQMTEYLEKNSLFSVFQSGFRKKHSTSTALLKVTDDIRVNADAKKLTFLCLLDFSKAFDMVIHGRLYNKLVSSYGFSKSAASLVFSYLTGRLQMVRVNDEVSDETLVTSGVPQGSILGPLLFSLYIADVSDIIRYSSFHLYADDLQIYRASLNDPNSISDCVQLLNNDLDGVVLWADANGLKLNADKTQSIVLYKSVINTSNFPNLTVGNFIIPYSSKVKNLGLLISCDLKWDAHVDSVCRKIFFSIRSLWKITQFANDELRRRLVVSFVFPLFLYADVVLFGMSKRCQQKLERCFNACIRYVYKLRKYDHLSFFRDRIIGCGLSVYLDFRACWFIGQLLRSRIPGYLFDKISLSFNYATNFRLILRRNNAQCSNSSIFVKGLRLWNSLPLSIKVISSRAVFLDRYLDWRRRDVYTI